jgi:hypothetical protein
MESTSVRATIPEKYSTRLRTIILVLFLLLSPFLKPLKSQTVNDSIHALFIGNSITYFNNMPFTFESISNNLGKKVKVSMYAPGGTGIVNHYIDPNVYNLFRQQVWDVIVIQAGSNESAGVSFPIDTTAFRGHILLDSAYKYSPCAKVYLYEIPYGVPSDTSWNIYFSRQQMYRDSLSKLADLMQVQMIPAGECVRAYYALWPNLLLHNVYNDIHPGPYGSFMIASAFYNGIFQDSVSQCTFYSTLPADSAKKFFAITDTVVLNHLSDWRINTYNLHADFSYIQSGNDVTFQNSSTNYASLSWSFGDNSFSSVENPVHSYSSIGSYIVHLVATDGLCTDSMQMNVIVDVLPDGISHLQAKEPLVYPNPSFGTITIDITTKSNIELYTLQGSMVFNEIIEQGKHTIRLELSGGVYMLKVTNDQGSRNTMVVIQ